MAILMVSAARAAPPEKASGVWAGSIALDGLTRPLVLQLEERSDGRLLGYVLGHSGEEVVVSGSAVHKDVSVALEIATAAGKRSVSIAGRLKGRDQIIADATVGATVQALDFRRITGNVRERRFLVAVPLGGDDFIVNDLVALTTAAGAFVSGAFVGRDTCLLWGCEGGLDALAESADRVTLDFTFHTSDPCSAGSSARLTFNAETSMYSGSYILRTCAGSTTGELLAVRDPATQSSDVAQFLSRLANLADRMESPIPFGATSDAFSPSYLDWGINLAALLGRYNQEKAKYTSIEASFSRISQVTTIIEPGTWQDLVRPLGAVFLETRKGVPAGGTAAETYIDSEDRPDRPLLRVWAQESTGWVIRGNGSPALDFPFAYSTTTDGLAVPVKDGAAELTVTLGPFGGHFAPVTGHAYGDLKANLVGYFTASDTGLTPLASGGFAFPGGVGGAELLARRPVYRAPLAGVLTRIECVGIAGPIYLRDQPNWSVYLRFPNGEELILGHVGEFHADLRAAVSSATGIDPGIVPCVRGVPVDNIFGGEVAIPVAAHTLLAWPQVVAIETAPGSGLYTGGGSYDRPWVQMEFFFKSEMSNRAWQDTRAACYYNYMNPALQARLQAAMLADMTNPSSQRYRKFQGTDWRWRLKAEARLCMAPSDQPRDYRDLYTNLGGWYEFPRATNDEIVAFAPVAKDVSIYDPSDYHSPATSMLLARRRANATGPLPYLWLLPDRGTVPVSVSYPDGEIVERTADTLLIRWRNLVTSGAVSTVDYWQRAAYSLAPTGLKIRWGGFSSTPEGARSLALPPDAPCNGNSIVCYNHDAYYAPGF